MFSIIVPCFNEKNRIERLLLHLQEQTKKPEIVIVDGGSKDGTIELIKKYQKKMKNLKLYFEKGKNRSPANARNIGKKKSKGPFILFMDVDGYLSKNATELIKKQADKYPKAVALMFKIKPYPLKDFNSNLQKLFYCRDVLRPNRVNKFRRRKKDKYAGNFFVYNKNYYPDFDPVLGFGEDRITQKQIRQIFKKNDKNIFYSNKVISYAQVGCSTISEIFKRFKWYGRTIPLYLQKVDDKKVKYYYYLAVLGIPFIPLYLIPIIRGIYFGIALFKDCWWAIFVLPIVEVIAFYSLMIGFYQRLFGNKISGR